MKMLAPEGFSVSCSILNRKQGYYYLNTIYIQMEAIFLFRYPEQAN